MSGISKIDNMSGTYIGLTKDDIEKYKFMINEKYAVEIKEIKEINSKYIGGCILENENQGIFIDNTLLNMIDERLKG